MMLAADTAARGEITPGGVAALLVIGTSIAWMFGVARGTWPTPLDFVRTLSGRDVPGQDHTSSGDMDNAEGGSPRTPGQEPPLRSPDRPWRPDRWGARPIGEVYADRRSEVGLADEDLNEAPADDDGSDDPVIPIRAQPAHVRRRWLRDRANPGDPIAAQCRTVRDLEERAARDLGVDTRTIRRDRAHLAKAAAARTGRVRT